MIGLNDSEMELCREGKRLLAIKSMRDRLDKDAFTLIECRVAVDTYMSGSMAKEPVAMNDDNNAIQHDNKTPVDVLFRELKYREKVLTVQLQHSIYNDSGVPECSSNLEEFYHRLKESIKRVD